MTSPKFNMTKMDSSISRLLLVIDMIAMFLCVHGITDPTDVNGLQILYSSFNSPPRLTGWKSQGGDPCGESWQGVHCTGPKVTSIKLTGQNLGGSLGYALDKLANLAILDLSNNQIGQQIPYQLPPQLRELYLTNNQFTGLPYSLKDLSSLTALDVSHNQLTGTIPDVFQNLAELKTLIISDNQLSGTLPSSMANLNSISTMRLQNNQLTGDLNVLAGLPLQELNVENNKFSGWVPGSLRSIPNLRDGNNNFSASPAPPPPPFTSPPSRTRPRSPPGRRSSPKSSNKENGGFWTGGKIAAFVVALILVAAIGVALFLCLRRRKNEGSDVEKQRLGATGGSWFGSQTSTPPKVIKAEQKTKLSSPEKVLKPPPLEKFKPPAERSPIKAKSGKISVAVNAYSVADLQTATNSFSQENLLGEGCIGRVYRAELPSTTLLAVKKLDASGPGTQTTEEFLATVSSLARLRHPNITELVGYCAEYGQRILVYEYLTRGTLHDMLHYADETSKRLSWNQRVKIALGSARALEYLHEVTTPAVVHRNFKSANILLDDDLNPHLSDCGLAALNPAGSDGQVTTQMMMLSSGYSVHEKEFTVKSDVYSFGVVMLELLTGRKPLDSSRSRSEQSLVRWATPQLHDIDALSKMVDPALQGIYPAKSLSRFADIISSCIQPEAEFRPSMSEVVQSLVRLVQRVASLGKRNSADDLSSSQRMDPLDSLPYPN